MSGNARARQARPISTLGHYRPAPFQRSGTTGPPRFNARARQARPVSTLGHDRPVTFQRSGTIGQTRFNARALKPALASRGVMQRDGAAGSAAGAGATA